ncbi:hypothetical protein LSTR_LSTR013958 [Laodelphax striatellus]|uniref:Peptidase S1 domain-containing protein n=1 Tax=Laodelphax striatellus TaxID=195883 RepID=A0A482WQL5_LAOST|nr:hypothetical protein LSTR_LSTR013958 [Laodelphax striatellus]
MKHLYFLIAVVFINLVKGILNPRFHRNWGLLNQDGCGLQPALNKAPTLDLPDIGPEPVEVQEGEYPWVVQIHMENPAKEGADKENSCMGTIISKRHILTASSCFRIYECDPIDPHTISVVAGRTDLLCSDPVCEEHMKLYNVTQVFFRNTNGPPQEGQNIALIQMATDFDFNDFVRPICVENGYLIHKDYSKEHGMRVTGWGVNNYANNFTRNLMHARVWIYPEDYNDFIYKLLPESFQDQETYDTFFCVEARKTSPFIRPTSAVL